MKTYGIVCALAGFILAPTASGDYTTTVDPGQSYGVWEGWGTSLAWWAKAFGDRVDIADAMFTMQSATIGDETVPGLGLNIVRYNQGGDSIENNLA